MKRFKHTGFTIIELLISMIISLTMIFACASVYSSLQASISVSQKLSTAQESLRTAHYLMSRSVRQGYGMQLSGANSSSALVVTYGSAANDHLFYGCLGARQMSGATDTFFVANDHLSCSTKISAGASTETAVIALNVSSLSASLEASPKKGVDITLLIDGMPGETTGTMGVDGFTFSLAMRQRILVDSNIAGASGEGL